jgi:hypothetical protein
MVVNHKLVARIMPTWDFMGSLGGGGGAGL